MNLFKGLKRIQGFLDARAAWFLAAGLGVALVVNARAWRRGRKRLAEVKALERPLSPLPSIPAVTFLVPAWNELQNLSACVESILGLRYPNKQLILCAGGTDGTLDMAQHYENEQVVILEQRPGEGKQGALRRCFERSRGEIIFLTDADCILDDGCFERTLEPIIRDGEDVTTGAWRPLNRQLGQPFVQYQWAHHIHREVMMTDYALALDGRNAAVQRSAIEESGGFAVDAPIGTDYVLSRQLAAQGYRIRFVRQSHVQTLYPETTRAYWRQQSRWFRNWFLLSNLWGEPAPTLSLLQATVPAAFLLAVPAVGGSGSRLLWAAWLAIVAHLSLSALRFAGVLWISQGQKPRIQIAARFVTYLPLGWLATIRGLVDSFLPARSKTW